MDEKKRIVIEYWRENVGPCKDMTDEEILESILFFAIRREYDDIQEYKKAKTV